MDETVSYLSLLSILTVVLLINYTVIQNFDSSEYMEKEQYQQIIPTLNTRRGVYDWSGS